jgi:hypothetical protein
MVLFAVQVKGQVEGGQPRTQVAERAQAAEKQQRGEGSGLFHENW